VAYRDAGAAALRQARLERRAEELERRVGWIESLPNALSTIGAKVRGAPSVLKRWRALPRSPTACELDMHASAAFGVDGLAQEIPDGVMWEARDGARGRRIRAWVVRGEDGPVLQVWDERRFDTVLWLLFVYVFLFSWLALGLVRPEFLFGAPLILLQVLSARLGGLRETRERACMAIALEESLRAAEAPPAPKVRVATDPEAPLDEVVVPADAPAAREREA
jgi:hypothetical protein